MSFFIASAVLAAAGSIAQGIQSKNMASFQSAVSRQQAELARREALQNERDFRKRQSAVLSQFRADLGGSGIEIGTGTELLAQEDFLNEVEVQARRIREGGEIRATSLEQQAALQRMSGRNAMTAGFSRAGSSLLTGFANEKAFG